MRYRDIITDEWEAREHPRSMGGEEGGQFVAKGASTGTAPVPTPTPVKVATPAIKPVVKQVAGVKPATLAPKTGGVWEPTTVVNGKRVTASGAPLPPHIAALVIPPAWTDVKYSPDPNATLLVVGRDIKGRRQPIYQKDFHAKNAKAKFARIKALDRKFDSILRMNERARKSKDPVTAALGDCAALIMATGIRPGSNTDTLAEKKAYGATTLEGRHVVQTGDGIVLQFTGKKGVDLSIPVNDPDMKAMLLRRKATAGDDGQLFPIDQRKLLRYVKGFGAFKTKDFRTLMGTRLAMEAIENIPAPKDAKEYKKAVASVAKIVSSHLGNTPTVALQSYINPVVFAEWRVNT